MHFVLLTGCIALYVKHFILYCSSYLSVQYIYIYIYVLPGEVFTSSAHNGTLRPVPHPSPVTVSAAASCRFYRRSCLDACGGVANNVLFLMRRV